MLSLTFEQAFEHQSEYRASDETTLQRIGAVTLVAFVGPTSAGKNYNMSRLDYPQAGTLTNRNPRDSDKSYRYFDKESMLDMIQQGTLVQYAALRPDRFYGSDADCYEAGITVMDVTSVAIEALYTQGFANVLPVGILARPKDWRSRLDKRFKGMGRDEIAGRLDEAEISINAITHDWNRDRLALVSAPMREASNLEIMELYIQTGQTPKNELAHKVGKEMLSILPDLRKQYLR